MGTANSGGGGDLDGLASQHGVTVGMGSASGSPFDTTVDDYDVKTGREKRSPGKGEWTMQEEAGFLYGGVPMDYTREFPTLKKRSELEKQLYGMPDEDVPELQRRLWAGGFYPPGTKPEEIVLGDRDPYTEKAWQNAIDRAGKYLAAGRDLTLDEVIDLGANIEGAGARNGKSGRDGRGALVVELANPEDLRYYAQRTAVSTLGRPLRPDELNRFISSFHQSQQASQAQAYNAGGTGGPGGSVVSAASPAAAAETFARQAAPAEAGAHDFVKVYDVFSKMLGGRRPQ